MSTQQYVQARLSRLQVDAPPRGAPLTARARPNLTEMPQSALMEIIKAHIIAGPLVLEEANPEDDNLDPKFVATCSGCLGGIAIDVLAPRKADVLAVIGTGPAAEAQLEVAIAVRTFSSISLYGRQPVAATALEKRFRNKTTASISVVASPEIAVHKADVIILASEQPESVIDADWVKPTAHVSAIISTGDARQPLPKGLLQRARTVASDDPNILGGNVIRNQDLVSGSIVQLGALVGKFNPDTHREITVFVSANPLGLARAATDTICQS